MMVDLHSHLMPGIDDGAADSGISMEMLRIAVADGITHIVVTPHYINGAMDNNLSVVRGEFGKFAGMAEDAGLDIKVYPGSEIFVDPAVPELVRNGQICTLNGSSYVLIELPMMSIPKYSEEVIYRLRLDGYTPIIAHPERNKEILKNPDILYNLIHKGVLVQVNSTSLTGLYGSRIKEAALAFLRHGMVHFVASDAHTVRGRSPKLSKARGIVEAEMGAEIAEKLFETNGLAVISNKVIETAEPEKIKNGKSFGFSTFFLLFGKKMI